MRTIWTVVLAGACLGACSWVEAARTPAPTPTPEQTSASDDAKCQSYGAAPGTQPYFQCRLAIDQQREQSRGGLASAITSQPAAPLTLQSTPAYPYPVPH